MVQVDGVGDLLALRQRDHLLALFDLVGDGLLAEYGDARLQQLHGGREVVAAVLLAFGAHAARIQLDAARQHLLDAVERPAAELRRAGVRLLLDDVAARDDFTFRVVLVAAGVYAPDIANADDADF